MPTGSDTKPDPLLGREGRALSPSAPAVSVIIPTYNCAPFIGEALESVFAQTFTDYEVIVVNDGSPDTDELERILQPYRDRVVYIRQENRGPSAARNAGIRAARAPLVALLDSDDAWYPDYLAEEVAALQRDPTIAVIKTKGVRMGEVPGSVRTFMELCLWEGEATFEQLVLHQRAIGGNLTARRNAILRAGMFDELLWVSEDFDLYLRIVKGGGRIVYHSRALYRVRRRRGSISSDPIRARRASLQVLEKAERTMALTPSEADAVSRSRTPMVAHLRLLEGKRALQTRDTRGAIEALREANTFFRRWKIALALLLLRVAPGVLFYANRLRPEA